MERQWPAVCMLRCCCVSKQQPYSARFWLWGNSRRRIICAWLRSALKGKITWSAWLDASIRGPVTASQRLSSMIEGRSSPAARARQVLVDRLGIITEQAPPYAPSAKGTVESLFRWMTERFEKRLPNSSYGVHDAEAA